MHLGEGTDKRDKFGAHIVPRFLGHGESKRSISDILN